MKLLNVNLLTASLAGTTQIPSETIDVRGLYCFSVHYIIAGSSFAGTFTVQGSNDLIDLENGQSVTNWATIGSAVTISAAASVMINLDGQGYKYLRVLLAPNNGVGTLVANFNGKGA